MKKIVTLGEIMLRLSPPDRRRIFGATSFDINYGGGESNVATALSQYGIPTRFVTKLPENDLGRSAIKHLKSFGVDTSEIVLDGNKMGIYFLETGYSVRNSSVIYDRANSEIYHANLKDFNIKRSLEGFDILLVSGITLGLSENGFLIGREFMKVAKDMGMKVAFDFNYRSKLWGIEEASKKIRAIMDYTDIIFAGHLDFINFLKLDVTEELNLDDPKPYYEEFYKKLKKQYNLDYIVSTFRKTISASNNEYYGMVFNGNEIIESKRYNIDIIDRVGSGDACTAGFLYGYATERTEQYLIDFAIASAALKHTIHGDTVNAKVEEVESLFKATTYDVAR